MSDRKIEEVTDMIDKIMEEKYPQTMKEMRSLIEYNFKVFKKKQSDYGPNNILIHGDRRLSLLGIAIRSNDKIQRILNLLGEDREPENESLEYSFLDLANYSYMACILMRKKWGK